jgi:hypothetical protein
VVAGNEGLRYTWPLSMSEFACTATWRFGGVCRGVRTFGCPSSSARTCRRVRTPVHDLRGAGRYPAEVELLVGMSAWSG